MLLRWVLDTSTFGPSHKTDPASSGTGKDTLEASKDAVEVVRYDELVSHDGHVRGSYHH